MTADHGCDPTTPSTDHSREYVPLLAYRPRKQEGSSLGLRSTLSDIGQTVAQNFGTQISQGTSFLRIAYPTSTTHSLMRRPIMAGNWKMYKTPSETAAFFEKFRPLVANSSHCDIVICPPFVDLAAAVEACSGTHIQIGGQNLYWAKEGAYHRRNLAWDAESDRIKWVIVAHSERRQYFGETEESRNKKILAALESGLTPDLLRRREGSRTRSRQDA